MALETFLEIPLHRTDFAAFCSKLLPKNNIPRIRGSLCLWQGKTSVSVKLDKTAAPTPAGWRSYNLSRWGWQMIVQAVIPANQLFWWLCHHMLNGVTNIISLLMLNKQSKLFLNQVNQEITLYYVSIMLVSLRFILTNWRYILTLICPGISIWILCSVVSNRDFIFHEDSECLEWDRRYWWYFIMQWRRAY